MTAMASSMLANRLTAAPPGLLGGRGRRPPDVRGVRGRAAGEQPLDVLGDHVGLEVDAVADVAGAERRDLEGVGDQPDPEPPRSGSRRSTTVRLTPSTVTEPFGTR
jgi:hypothetical protein